LEADASSPPPSDPAYAFRNGDIDLGSRDTPPPTGRPGDLNEDDSEMEDFLVDDDAEIEMDDDSGSELPSSLGISRRPKEPMGTQARLTTLKNMFSDDEDGEDADGDEHGISDAEQMDSSLPDLKDLLSTNRKRNSGGTQPSQPKVKRKRMVVDDDDDDDE
jgi:hypothetical protein